MLRCDPQDALVAAICIRCDVKTNIFLDYPLRYQYCSGCQLHFVGDEELRCTKCDHVMDLMALERYGPEMMILAVEVLTCPRCKQTYYNHML